jgi:hypothetical protein
MPTETVPNQSLEWEVVLEAERLTGLVRKLREECEGLRAALAKAEAERDRSYEILRTTFPFENVTIEELQASSAGPVETI